MAGLDITKIANGALVEQLNHEVNKIYNNIKDPNTKSTDTRKVTLTITFKPDDYRTNVAVAFQTKTSMVPTMPIKSNLIVDIDDEGKCLAAELTAAIPGQRQIVDHVDEEHTTPKVVSMRKGG